MISVNNCAGSALMNKLVQLSQVLLCLLQVACFISSHRCSLRFRSGLKETLHNSPVFQSKPSSQPETKL